MKTVSLRGKKARGRVVRVDDGDHERVTQHRWFVLEKPATATTRGGGPYAIANVVDSGGRRRTIFMHDLIMGAKGVDHIDHDGLNNQRSNLRLATHAENMRNTRSHRDSVSSYKGVSWSSRKRKWMAHIRPDGRSRHLGYFYSELEAAYAYDEAARQAFGEFAGTNFPEPPTRAMRDEWQAASAAILAERLSSRGARHSEWLARRELETHVCTVCGNEFQSRSLRPTLYCGTVCKSAVARRRKKERELEGRLF